MRSAFAAVLSFGVLAGCSLPPAEDAGEEEPVIAVTGIPDELAGHLAGIDFVPASNTLILTVTGLDGPDEAVTYLRKAALDIGPYQAYTFQQNALNRHFTAFGAESAGGEVMALVVADGGQFNRYFGGGYYVRDGQYFTPTGAGGQVTYAGDYAGVTNLDSPGADLRVPNPAVDPAVLPAQAATVDANILINVNFADNLVNGIVYDRVLDHSSGNLALPDIALVSSDLSDDGTFYGVVEFDTGNQTAAGNYGGILGGADAGYIGGVVRLTDIDDTLFGWTGDEEYGVFVLTQCGQVGQDAICNSLD